MAKPKMTGAAGFMGQARAATGPPTKQGSGMQGGGLPKGSMPGSPATGPATMMTGMPGTRAPLSAPKPKLMQPTGRTTTTPKAKVAVGRAVTRSVKAPTSSASKRQQRIGTAVTGKPGAMVSGATKGPGTGMKTSVRRGRAQTRPR